LRHANKRGNHAGQGTRELDGSQHIVYQPGNARVLSHQAVTGEGGPAIAFALAITAMFLQARHVENSSPAAFGARESFRHSKG